jgi:hypothetical protein
MLLGEFEHVIQRHCGATLSVAAWRRQALRHLEGSLEIRSKDASALVTATLSLGILIVEENRKKRAKQILEASGTRVIRQNSERGSSEG